LAIISQISIYRAQNGMEYSRQLAVHFHYIKYGSWVTAKNERIVLREWCLAVSSNKRIYGIYRFICVPVYITWTSC